MMMMKMKEEKGRGGGGGDSLEITWQKLMPGLVDVLKGKITKNQIRQRMEMYDITFAYCSSAHQTNRTTLENEFQDITSPSPSSSSSSSSSTSTPSSTTVSKRLENPSAQIGGSDLYRQLLLLIEIHTSKIASFLSKCSELHRDTILFGYTREWNRFAAASELLITYSDT